MSRNVPARLHPPLQRLRRWGPGLLSLLLVSSAAAAPLMLALAGDVNLARGVAQVHERAWGRTFAPLAAALRADVTFANLESPLTSARRHGGGLDLRASPAAVTALRPFTLLGVDNNHAQDGGAAGQRQTRQVLARAGVMPVDRFPRVLTRRGVRVAWVAFLDGGEGAPWPLAEVRAARRLAGPGGLVVVAPHWGEEYRGVSTRQRQGARALATAGADVIVGSGPHVLQGSERVGKGLVLYSLGNLMFDQPYPATWPGAVVRVTRSGPGAALHVCAVPTFSRAGQVRRATAREAAHILGRLRLPACAGPGAG